MQAKRCIICAGGNSIQEGLDKGLLDVLKNEFTIGLNSWYQFTSTPTVCTWVDHQWYFENYEQTRDLFLVGKQTPEISKYLQSQLEKINPQIAQETKRKSINSRESYQKFRQYGNLAVQDYFIPMWHEYQSREGLKHGLYDSKLVGMYALSLAVALGFNQIYLLGYDGCAINGKTHFYQDKINPDDKGHLNQNKWRGVGINPDTRQYKNCHFNNHVQLNRFFEPFATDAKLNNFTIKNVSPLSVITQFPRIDYDHFFELIKSSPNDISQEEMRGEVYEKIKNYYI